MLLYNHSINIESSSYSLQISFTLNSLVFTYWCYKLAVISYLLTSWGRDLLENLTGSQLVQEFLSFYETRKFITAFTSVRHLSIP
jgi:hypothetical protein